jgi:SAM-dependent methyltransferase
MPVNLSFSDRDTDRFYTPIHTEIAAQREAPTTREFAGRLRRTFSDPRALSALDAGCGAHAINARACIAHGFGVVRAIDRNEDAVRMCRDIGVEHGSVLELPYPAASFDLVVCSGVAHHTPAPDLALKELRRVLKPGGVAYISLYAFAGSPFEWLVRCWRGLGRFLPYRMAHRLFRRIPTINNFVLDHAYVPVLWLYTAAEARDALQRAGFGVTEEFVSRFDFLHRYRATGDGLLRIFVVRSDRQAPSR